MLIIIIRFKLREEKKLRD